MVSQSFGHGLEGLGGGADLLSGGAHFVVDLPGADGDVSKVLPRGGHQALPSLFAWMDRTRSQPPAPNTLPPVVVS